MSHTVVAVFDKFGDAQSAINALYKEGGFTKADVKLSPSEESTESRQHALSSVKQITDTGGWSIGDFFRSLFSSNQHSDDAGIYAESVRRGAYLLSIDAQTEEQATRAADIMQRFHAVDLGQRSSHWRSSGWAGYQSDAPLYTADEIQKERSLYGQTTVGASAGAQAVSKTSGNAATSGEVIPVIQEQLEVGKRAEQKGGVRIFSHVTEKQVQESVQLPEEDVKVEQFGTQGTAKGASMTEDEFRQHWQGAYGSSGGKYEDYESAYRYGSQLANQQKYHGYRWEQLEPEVKSDWEAIHSGSPWERTKQAVKYGWEKMKGH
jgi:hypothetical protein